MPLALMLARRFRERSASQSTCRFEHPTSSSPGLWEDELKRSSLLWAHRTYGVQMLGTMLLFVLPPAWAQRGIFFTDPAM